MVSLEVTFFVAYVFESQLTRATGGKGYKLLSVGPALSSVEAGRTYRNCTTLAPSAEVSGRK